MDRESTDMTAVWHPIEHDPALGCILETELHSRVLRVEHREEEAGWRWRVLTAHRTQLAEGVASGCHAAQRAAEDEAYRFHPVTGDPVAWWRDT